MTLLGQIKRAGGELHAAPGEAMDLTPWLESWRGAKTASGRSVSVEGALGLAAIWAALRVLCDTASTLPLHTYHEDTKGAKTKVSGHPTYKLLHERPNPEMTAATVWSIVVAHLNLWNDAFLGKEFLGDRVVALWPIRPDRVRITRKAGVKLYFVRDANGIERQRPYTDADIIHIQGITLDGVRGTSPIQRCMESIGGALAVDEFANRFFANNAIPPAVVNVTGTLDDDATKRFMRRWNALFRGSRNQHKVAVLENGTDLKVLQANLRDTQLVELRKFYVQEAARIMRVPVSFLEGDRGSSLTYSTVEADNLYLATHSIRPLCVRIEQGIGGDRDLFPPAQRMSCEFSLDGLLRASGKTRAEIYQLALDPEKGWMWPSEARDLENLPPDSTFDERHAAISAARARPAAAPTPAT